MWCNLLLLLLGLLAPWSGVLRAAGQHADRLPQRCKYFAHRGRCGGDYTAYYYDAESKKCRTFTWTGCGGNPNKFADLETCIEKCASYEFMYEKCKLPPEKGKCTYKDTDDFEQYYYDVNTKKCQKFLYSGCGGNWNRFMTEASCSLRCEGFD